MTADFAHYLKNCQQRINNALAKNLGAFSSEYATSPTSELNQTLCEAMHYSLLNPGKRVRPLLVYASYETIAGQSDNQPASTTSDLDKIASAIECIHAYSLIHDDLPAMDDDDLRRGQPTCHRKFDEATAILAGDALQARAFELLTELQASSAVTSLALIKQLSAAAGQRGMVGGQAIDLAAMNQSIELDHLETMHRLKTGALIRAAIAMGAIYAGADDHQLQHLDDYGAAIGLAFQVQDDILDVVGNSAEIGKPQGSDQQKNKPTYPALLSLEGARQKNQALAQQANDALAPFGSNALHLQELVTYIISRQH